MQKALLILVVLNIACTVALGVWIKVEVGQKEEPPEERKSPAGYACKTTSDCAEGLACWEYATRRSGAIRRHCVAPPPFCQ